MTELLNAFEASRELFLANRYAFLFAIGLIEGTWTGLGAGVLAASGVFSPPAAIAILLVTETVGGFIYFGIGYLFGSKGLDHLAKHPGRRELLSVIRTHAERSGGWIVFFVKVTYSITTPTLIALGALRYSARKFALINALGSVIWVAIIFSVGYLLGDRVPAYFAGVHSPWALAFLALVTVVVLALGLRAAGSYVWRRLFPAPEPVREPAPAAALASVPQREE